MLEFFCGVPEIVPDNLRSGVTKACRYDPDINPAYLQWANHYGTVIIPASAVQAQGQGKGRERGTDSREKRACADQKRAVFFSLAELNGRVGKLVASANLSFQKLEGSRTKQFGKVDLPALGALPPYPYTYTDIKRAKVNIDYHVEYRNPKLYSVPCAYRGERVEVHATENIIMVYLQKQAHSAAQTARQRTLRYGARSHARGSQGA